MIDNYDNDKNIRGLRSKYLITMMDKNVTLKHKESGVTIENFHINSFNKLWFIIGDDILFLDEDKYNEYDILFLDENKEVI